MHTFPVDRFLTLPKQRCAAALLSSACSSPARRSTLPCVFSPLVANDTGVTAPVAHAVLSTQRLTELVANDTGAEIHDNILAVVVTEALSRRARQDRSRVGSRAARALVSVLHGG